ncbi:ATP-dependent DNA helicase [Trichonephila inaurata madagascariensis]|uniref:ATP-dependent DNA helicase n=1 Tax=Trichonephila inaurata madagascariensis TaxID=2747483 RepID=A0A8X6WVL8_9ARAC|nr:ATP-dependent DNA helicase [Trichonephila inaurata madagascariensis]
MNSQKTTMMAFFELYKVDDFAKLFCIAKFQHTMYGKITNFIEEKKRKAVSGYLVIKKNQVWGRVYTVYPGNFDCYYVRLLLHMIPGPTSFTALKIVAGVVQSSFQAACRALGLLEHDAN